jgi:hypothetical protein
MWALWRTVYQHWRNFWFPGDAPHGITRKEHLDAWIQFSSGLSLLYLGPQPRGPRDEYVARIMTAQQTANLDELDHVTSLMLTLMRDKHLLKGCTSRTEQETLNDLQAQWHSLDRAYHGHFCNCMTRIADT